MTRTLVCGILLLAAIRPEPVLAQSSSATIPWEVSASGSAGNLSDDCGGCPLARPGDFGYLTVRGGLTRAVTPQIRVGAEGMWWGGSHQSVTRRLSVISATAAWYPISAGLRIDGSAGWFHYREDRVRASGVAFQGGLGWDFLLAGPLVGGPFVRYLHSLRNDATIDGEATGLTFRPHMLGAGIRLAARF